MEHKNIDFVRRIDFDRLAEACRMLAEHDLVVVPGSVMRECMNVLHILACDTESVEEGLELQAMIHHIEAAWAHGMPPNAIGQGSAACRDRSA